jgi:hypothetical protein
MNIKLKAALIAIAMPIVAGAVAYTIVQFPILLVASMFGGAVYCFYRGVLSHLEFREKYNQKKVK